jgi:nicotinate-nucleotide adenylyltransferase
MRVAIFGGSFDPPHLGHQKIIVSALDTLHIDKLFLVPTSLNPFKEKFFATGEQRIAWLKKLFSHYKKIEILDYEIKQERAVPSIETVRYLLNHYDIEKVYLIIGADNYGSLDQWNHYKELSSLVEFVVATRDEIALPKNLIKLSINAKMSSSKLRSNMNTSFIPKPIAFEINEYYTRNIMKKRIKHIVEILDDKKAEDIQVFDMHGKDYFVDTVIIATAMGARHSLSLLDDLKKGLKDPKESFLHIDDENEWVVIDLGDILIHIMSAAYRSKYNLEEFLAEREREMQRIKTEM